MSHWLLVTPVAAGAAPSLRGFSAKSPLIASPFGAGLCQRGDRVFWRAGTGNRVLPYKCVSVIIFGTSLSLCVALSVPSCCRKEESLPSCLWGVVSISSAEPGASRSAVTAFLECLAGVAGVRGAQKYSTLLRLCNCPGGRLAAVIALAQRQRSLLSLLPVWIDLWANLQMNGCRWEKQPEINASFVPVTATNAIKGHAKTLMK